MLIYDRVTKKMRGVRLPLNGSPQEVMYRDPSVSDDGRVIAFSQFSMKRSPHSKPSVWIFIYDRVTGCTAELPQTRPAADFAGNPSISGDGRYVAFDCSGGVFMYDRQTHVTRPVTPLWDGVETSNRYGSACVSRDGKYIAYSSSAIRRTHDDCRYVGNVFVRNLVTREPTKVAGPHYQSIGRPSISANGRYLAFQLEETYDRRSGIYICDTQTGHTTKIWGEGLRR